MVHLANVCSQEARRGQVLGREDDTWEPEDDRCPPSYSMVEGLRLGLGELSWAFHGAAGGRLFLGRTAPASSPGADEEH